MTTVPAAQYLRVSTERQEYALDYSIAKAQGLPVMRRRTASRKSVLQSRLRCSCGALPDACKTTGSQSSR
jgi:hypothetical protein